jgi:hypothetical protein
LSRFSPILLLVGMQFASTTALAQGAPPPDDWRPMVYTNLRETPPSPDAVPYAELWQAEISANDIAYSDGGDTQYASGHAPATEAHFVVRSTQRVAVLTMLDTATGCTKKTTDASANASVKFCPLKIAIYEGGVVTTTAGRKGCFLELNAPISTDPSNSMGYATYDIANRSFKIGMIINHEPVSGCAETIAIDNQLTP